MKVSAGKVGHLLGFKTDLRSGSQPKPDIRQSWSQRLDSWSKHARTPDVTPEEHSTQQSSIMFRWWRTGHRGVPSDLSVASSSGTSAGANLSWNTKATAPRAALLSVDVGGGRFRWLHRAETSHDVKTAQLHLWIKKRYRLRFRCVWWLTPRTSWKK